MNLAPLIMLGAFTLAVVVALPAYEEELGLSLPFLGTQTTVDENLVATAIDNCNSLGITTCHQVDASLLCQQVEWTQIHRERPFSWEIDGFNVQQEHVEFTPCTGRLVYSDAEPAFQEAIMLPPCLADEQSWQVVKGTGKIGTDLDGDGIRRYDFLYQDATIGEDCRLQYTTVQEFYAGDDDDTNSAIKSCTTALPPLPAGHPAPRPGYYYAYTEVHDNDEDSIKGFTSTERQWGFADCTRLDGATGNAYRYGPDGNDDDTSVGYRYTPLGIQEVFLPCANINVADYPIMRPVVKDRDQDYVPYIGFTDHKWTLESTCKGFHVDQAGYNNQYLAGDPNDSKADDDVCGHAKFPVAYPSGVFEDRDSDDSWRLNATWSVYTMQSDCTWQEEHGEDYPLAGQAYPTWFGDYDDTDPGVQGYALSLDGVPCVLVPTGVPTAFLGPVDIDGDGIPQIQVLYQDARLGACTHVRGGEWVTYGDPDDSDDRVPLDGPCNGGFFVDYYSVETQDADQDNLDSVVFTKGKIVIDGDCVVSTEPGSPVLVVGDPDEHDLPGQYPCQAGFRVESVSAAAEDNDQDGVPAVKVTEQSFEFTGNGCDYTTMVGETTVYGDEDDSDPSNGLPDCTVRNEPVMVHTTLDEDGDGARAWVVTVRPCEEAAWPMHTIGIPCYPVAKPERQFDDCDDTDPDTQGPSTLPCPGPESWPWPRVIPGNDADGDGIVDTLTIQNNTMERGRLNGGCMGRVDPYPEPEPWTLQVDPDPEDPENPGCATIAGTTLATVPGVSINDQDGDLVYQAHIGGTRDVYLDGDCNPGFRDCAGCDVPVGDPDDGNPDVPVQQGCPPFSIRHYDPLHYSTEFMGLDVPWNQQDLDGDGIYTYRLGSTWTNATAGCSFTQEPGADYVLNADPDDTDPDAPVNLSLACGSLDGRSFWLPTGVPVALDEDGDGVPRLQTMGDEWTLGPRCTYSTSNTARTLAIDPDDNDPDTPLKPACTFVTGTYEVPSGYEERDQDGDGFGQYRVVYDQVFVEADCDRTRIGTTHGAWTGTDPNDNDPDVPRAQEPCANWSPTVDYVSWVRYTDEDNDGVGSIDAEYGNVTVTPSCKPHFQERGDPPLIVLDPDDQDPYSPTDWTGCAQAHIHEVAGEPTVVDNDLDAMVTGVLAKHDRVMGFGCAPGVSVHPENLFVGPDPDDEDELVPGPCFAYEGTTWSLADNATWQDEDGDGIPVILIQHTDHQIQRDCSTTGTHNRTQYLNLDGNDNDDQYPIRSLASYYCENNETCTIVEGVFEAACAGAPLQECLYQVVCTSDQECLMGYLGEVQALYDTVNGTILGQQPGNTTTTATTTSATTTTATTSTTSGSQTGGGLPIGGGGSTTQSSGTGAGGSQTGGTPTTDNPAVLEETEPRFPWMVLLLVLGGIVIAALGARRRL